MRVTGAKWRWQERRGQAREGPSVLFAFLPTAPFLDTQCVLFLDTLRRPFIRR
jgi:hypothetical protein